jgi:polyisoprenoid-binding protein YceI
MTKLSSLVIVAAALAVTGAVIAQQPPSRPMMAPASKDPVAAAAGTYALDARHASVIARVAHGGGTSFSMFRFETISGTLDWNGAKPEGSKVSVKIDPKSINSPVAGFAAELAGERYLNVAKFPESSFISTAIQRTGPTTGVITGNLTLMGVTRPVTVAATLVGAGRGMRGSAVVGFSGTTKFKRSDFGFSGMIGPIGDEIELLIDLEFAMAPPAAPRS